MTMTGVAEDQQKGQRDQCEGVTWAAVAQEVEWVVQK